LDQFGVGETYCGSIWSCRRDEGAVLSHGEVKGSRKRTMRHWDDPPWRRRAMKATPDKTAHKVREERWGK
jgi:hypothetical protein